MQRSVRPYECSDPGRAKNAVATSRICYHDRAACGLVDCGAMKTVSRFEANLLRLLHGFLQQTPLQQASPLLDADLERPPCLSRDAVALVIDTLGKGTVLLLARRGGWRHERHLRGGQVIEGRLWERTPPTQLGLTFSRNTLDFLMWLTAKKSKNESAKWSNVTDVTDGDEVFLHLSYEGLRGSEIGPRLLRSSPFDRLALTWLHYPDDHGRAGIENEPDFRPWVEGCRTAVLEALQPVLMDRWIQMENEKGSITGWQQMRNVGQAQETALDAFLTVIEDAGRLDLARFLLWALRRVVTVNATAELWTRSLREAAPRLADRAETYRGALAFLRQLPRLQQWERRARTVGYFDEGYHASQLWLRDWEQVEGDLLTERAQAIVHDLDPMRQTEDPS